MRNDPAEADEDWLIAEDQREKGVGILRQRLPLVRGVRPDSQQPAGITTEELSKTVSERKAYGKQGPRFVQKRSGGGIQVRSRPSSFALLHEIRARTQPHTADPLPLGSW